MSQRAHGKITIGKQVTACAAICMSPAKHLRRTHTILLQRTCWWLENLTRVREDSCVHGHASASSCLHYTVPAPAILAVGKNVWQVTWLAIWHWILLFGRNLNVPGPDLGHTRLSGISTFDKYVLAWIWCRVTHRPWLPWKRRWTPHLCSLGSQWTWRWVQWAQHPCQPATNGAAPRNHLQLQVKDHHEGCQVDDISDGRGLSTRAPQKWLRKGLIWKQHYTQVNLPTHLAHCFSPVCSKVAGWITACYGLHEIMTLMVLWPYETGHLQTMAEHPCQAAHAAHIDGSNLRILLWHAHPETKW